MITKVIGGTMVVAGTAAIVSILKNKRDHKRVLEKENELLEITESYVEHLELISKRGRDGWKEESPAEYNQNIFCRVNALDLSSTVDFDGKRVLSQIECKPSEKTGAEAYNLMLKLIIAAREYECICDISHDGNEFEYNARLHMFNESLRELENAVESLKAHLNCFR